MIERPRMHIKTFGCQMNRYDSDRMLEMMVARGYELSDDPNTADLVIVNTCSVREKPERKVQSFVSRIVSGSRHGEKGSRSKPVFVIAGCVAEQHGGEFLDMQPDVDLVIGPDHLHELPDLVERVKKGERISAVGEETVPSFLQARPSGPGVRVSEAVTIAKGCDNYCSYCIVPYVRGRERSRPAVQIVDEASGLVALGAREIVLIGQNVNSYSGEGGFPLLLERVSRIPGLSRLRFTTSHPKDFSRSLARQFKELDNLCEWLHMPFQSGSDRVLENMNRGYTRAQYLEKVAMYREYAPNGAIGADCIVGFPGETHKDFEDTMKLVEEVCFDQLFSFKYSPRPGTSALCLADDVPMDVKTGRLKELQELHTAMTRRKNLELVGTRQQVLVEGPSSRGDQMSGRTRSNKVVNFCGKESLVGSLVLVHIEEGLANSLRGRIEESAA
ncbi:MAG: tRNA (N6-isopentenyl adenosine(37)-C2)-methylthiotransferase MiaB [Deltaproteobacteria bacterium]|nr:tRNA (N6-isopentenyl adenosine(37)-C2)-methylthiotransferase MiaB [Deltaproteobacteria bacterium]